MLYERIISYLFGIFKFFEKIFWLKLEFVNDTHIE